MSGVSSCKSGVASTTKPGQLITQNSDGSNGIESCEQKILACWQKKDQQHVRLNQRRLESDEQQMLVFLKHTGGSAD